MSQLHVRIVVLSVVLSEGARQDDQDVPSNVAQLQKARENISSYSNKTNKRPEPKKLTFPFALCHPLEPQRDLCDCWR